MNTTFIEALNELLGQEQVHINEPMSKHTTFRIGGPADVYVEPSVDLVEPVIRLCKEHGVPALCIGNGSNLLVSDEGIEGVVVSLGKPAEGIELISEDKIKVLAGTMLSKLSNFAADNSLGGLEFAAGIPGSVGGACIMNAGAYGGEMKDVLVSCQVLTSEGQIEEWPVEAMDLSYRHSKMMEQKTIVLSAVVKLVHRDKEAIRATMDELRDKRVEKQPLEFPSAGSTFKRPEGYFAGKLIQDSGLRGYAVGDAQVSEKHCGFVINRGKATCRDVLQLMADVDSKVFEGFGVHLEPEVRIIGRL